MKLRYKLPLRCKDGLDIEDSNGTLAMGSILAVRGEGENKVITVLINFTSQVLNDLRSSIPPSPGVTGDANFVSGFECIQEE